MGWFNFLIYFALFAGAIVNCINGIGYLSGNIYSCQTGGEVTANTVYRHFGSGLQFVDVMFGLLLLALAVFSIVVRQRLANFISDAPRYLTILYVGSASISFLYGIAVTAITGISWDATQIISIIVTLTIMAVNISYFKKREHLFVNTGNSENTEASPRQKADDSSPTVTTPINKAEEKTSEPEVSFCQECGSDLSVGSSHCNKCGARKQMPIYPDMGIVLDFSSTCPHCHKIITVDSKFCQYCGTKINEDKQ
jgi:RNA polymerase subunit RPABC4/transcription elongation factor Spt4